MIAIYGNPSADGKYFGPSTNGAGSTFDMSDPANVGAHGLSFSGVFPRDAMITSAAVYAKDPVANSINFVLRVNGVDSIIVLNLPAGSVSAIKTKKAYNSPLALIIPANTLFAVRTDFVGSPTASDFLFTMETYFV